MKAVLRKLILAAVPVVLVLLIACAATPPPPPEPTATPTPEPTNTATPEPTATATPEPTTTPTRSPTATPTAEPLAQEPSGAEEGPLEGLVSRLSDEAWDFLVGLTLGHSPRASSSDQEKAAADFLVEVFEDMGYEAGLQTFGVGVLARDRPLLALHQPEPRGVEGLPLRMAGIGEATGALVDVGLARAEDIPEGGLAGKVAFIRRGTITFEEKVHRVEDAGAVAAVVYNSAPSLFAGTLSTPSGIPAVSVSAAGGELIAEAMAGGEVEATVSLVMVNYDSRNVIAEKPGAVVGGPVLVLGAHYDTVPDTQGANDNGSGLSVLFTIAREVADRSFPFTLRFVAFGSEEVGLFGSRHYVTELTEDDAGSIVAMLNFDVPGSGRRVRVIGGSDLAGRLMAYGDANGIDVTAGASLEGGGSDHVPFEEAGIPTLFFLSDDLSRINTALDTIEFVDRRLMGETVALALGLLDDLAREQEE